MIKANRLRIGTDVMVQGRTVRICAVTKKKIGYHRLLPYSGVRRDDRGSEVAYGGYELERDRMTYARLSDVEPIPLSAEYLEALGYEHTAWETSRNSRQDLVEETGELIELRSPDHRVIVNNMSNRPSPYDWYVHVDNEDFETTGGMDVAYVHELQGLLIDNDIKIN